MFGHQDRTLARRKGWDYIELGLLGQFVGAIIIAPAFLDPQTSANPAGKLLVILATAAVVAGCGTYAAFYGRTRAWGMLGLLSLPGVLMVLCLPKPRDARDRTGFGVVFIGPYRRDCWRMDVRVALKSLDCDEPISLQLPRGASIAAAVRSLAGPLPVLQREIHEFQFTLNGEPAKSTDEMSDGDRLTIALAKSDFSGSLHSSDANITH